MSNTFLTKQGAVAAGGTIISGAFDQDGRLLVATPAGLFQQVGMCWSALPNQPTIPFLQSFVSAAEFLFLAGSKMILYSADKGRTWNRGQLPPLEKPVICLTASPRFSEDRILLAGTDGAGILRSTDGGRHWNYASFGLHDFSVHALATAPAWNEREIVFAATDTGLFRSPNAGRSWKSVNHGLEVCVILSITPSPNFAEDRIVFVGTETDGIFRSCDAGFTWQQCLIIPNPHDTITAINAVWIDAAQNLYLAGTDDGHILRSPDRGQTWSELANTSTAIFCFFGSPEHLYVGTADTGLFTSEDAGETWNNDADLTVRQFTAFCSGIGNQVFAYGADEGIWRSDDSGQTWMQIGDFESILLTAAVANDAQHTRFAGTSDGLFRAEDSNPEWELVSPISDVTAIHLSEAFAHVPRILLGTWSGEIIVSEDRGHTWQQIVPPPTRKSIVSISIFHESPESELLITITFDPRTQTLSLWRRIGEKWQLWLESRSAIPAAQIVEHDKNSGEIFVTLGVRCWHWVSGLWHAVLKTDHPVLRLAQHPAGGLIALTADSILASQDIFNWMTLYHSEEGSLNDLVLMPNNSDRVTACVLTRGGNLLTGIIPNNA